MSSFADFKIDLGRTRPKLSKAPIVEAAIEVQAQPSHPWESVAIAEQLKSRLPDYTNVGSRKRVVQQTHFEPAGPQTEMQDKGWQGYMLKSKSTSHVAQFNRDGFLFSRLHPYETWEGFRAEAMRLWEIFGDLAQPTELQSASVRYINRIEMSPNELDFDKYIDPHPTHPRGLGLPFFGFLHQDVLAIPGHDYVLKIIRTMQRSPNISKIGHALLIDITASTMKPFEPSQAALDKRLSEMRWLKNEAFFGSVTQSVLDSLK